MAPSNRDHCLLGSNFRKRAVFRFSETEGPRLRHASRLRTIKRAIY